MPSPVHIPMPAGFLSLAPTTSSSYPVTTSKSRTTPASTTIPEPGTLPLTTTALAQVPAAVPVDSKQRTESLSSDGSKSGAGLRFLKLGPVHQGEHLDGAKGDWHELAAVE